jgi:hypothetical protein
MDGTTDMTKLIVAIRNFANAPKNYFTLCNTVGCVHETDAPKIPELRINRIGRQNNRSMLDNHRPELTCEDKSVSTLNHAHMEEWRQFHALPSTLDGNR